MRATMSTANVEHIATVVLPVRGATLVPGQQNVCSLTDAKNNKFEGAWKLWLAIAIALCLMCGEIAGGLIAHSLAVLTDAAHMLSDIVGFAISLAAGYYAVKQAHPAYTFGYHRFEVLGSLMSIFVIWIVTGVLIYEAAMRIIKPEKFVDGRIMFIIGSVAFGANLLMMYVLGEFSGEGHDHGHGHTHGHAHGHAHGHQEQHQPQGNPVMRTGSRSKVMPLGKKDGDRSSHVHDHLGPAHDDSEHGSEHAMESAAPPKKHVNGLVLRAAFIHVLGDTVQTVGVMIAGLIIWFKPQYKIVDPICTFIFGAIVFTTTGRILNDILFVLLERAPRDLKMEELISSLKSIEGVQDLHELHVWTIKPGMALLSAHVTVDEPDYVKSVMAAVVDLCHDNGIEHMAVEVAVVGADCSCTLRSKLG